MVLPSGPDTGGSGGQGSRAPGSAPALARWGQAARPTSCGRAVRFGPRGRAVTAVSSLRRAPAPVRASRLAPPPAPGSASASPGSVSASESRPALTAARLPGELCPLSLLAGELCPRPVCLRPSSRESPARGPCARVPPRGRAVPAFLLAGRTLQAARRPLSMLMVLLRLLPAAPILPPGGMPTDRCRREAQWEPWRQGRVPMPLPHSREDGHRVGRRRCGRRWEGVADVGHVGVWQLEGPRRAVRDGAVGPAHTSRPHCCPRGHRPSLTGPSPHVPPESLPSLAADVRRPRGPAPGPCAQAGTGAETRGRGCGAEMRGGAGTRGGGAGARARGWGRGCGDAGTGRSCPHLTAQPGPWTPGRRSSRSRPPPLPGSRRLFVYGGGSRPPGCWPGRRHSNHRHVAAGRLFVLGSVCALPVLNCYTLRYSLSFRVSTKEHT